MQYVQMDSDFCHKLEELEQLAEWFYSRGGVMNMGGAGILNTIAALLMTDDIGSMKTLAYTAMEVVKYNQLMATERARELGVKLALPIKSSQP